MRLCRTRGSRRWSGHALRRLKRSALQVHVTVNVRGDFCPLRKDNFLAVGKGHDRPRRGIVSRGLLIRTRCGSFIVGETNVFDVKPQFPAFAHASLGLGFRHFGARGRAAANQAQAIDENVFHNHEVHSVADMGGLRRNGLAEFQADGCVNRQREIETGRSRVCWRR